ncbi:phage tail protein [Winogradskyella haliclonae]
MFAGNFAPRGWALCEGQLLAISSNTALFSILGTTYGGDGRTTFALPDFRGRVPVGTGTGPGLSTYRLGQRGGSEDVILTSLQAPNMSYEVPAYDSSNGDSVKKGNSSVLTTGNKPNTTIRTNNSGRNQSINNMQPNLGINYIICLTGYFPSKS